MIYVISDTHIPERIAKLPQKLLDKIKPDDILFSAIGGSVYDRHAGDFVNWKSLCSLGMLSSPQVAQRISEDDNILAEEKTKIDFYYEPRTVNYQLIFLPL